MPTLPHFDVKSSMSAPPHVVILGAGASKAAFPNGDARGRIVPLMQEIPDVLGLNNLFHKNDIDIDGLGFEALYSKLAASDKYLVLVKEIDRTIYDYFSGLELPQEPTIYDYLLLSLRKTDLIATFNWDPFLAQAYQRNAGVVDLPQIVFLHGNVEIGICQEHKKKGFYFQDCTECGRSLEPTKLLYPIEHKNYLSDIYIKDEWDILRNFLNYAYSVTIFGYGAPVTDVEAKSLMLEVWKTNQTIDFAQLDIVDIKPEEELETTWDDFFVRNNYGIQKDIFDTYLFYHPRRSCDALAMASLQQTPWKDNKYPRFKTLTGLQKWIQPLIDEERNNKFSGKPCPQISEE